MPYPLSTRRGNQGLAEPIAGKSLPTWPRLLPNIVVGVAPLRNLTGEAERQGLVEDFTNRLVIDLFRHCRSLSFAWVADERRYADNLPPRNPRELSYVIYGSVQRGSYGNLRVNIRISDAITSDYLWAGRQEFRPEDVAPIQAEITLQISRAFHILLLREASRGALIGLDPGLGVDECLARAKTALRGGMRPELSAEAQRWFLAALAGEPRNVEALTGIALTCQRLVSNPWWGDPRACAAASDLGREAVTLALELEPTCGRAKSIQGMLYSAAGQLQEAADAFIQALAMDERLAAAHGFAGYNDALLGRAWETLPAIERAMRLDPTDRRHTVWYFFGGFAELLLGRTEEAIVLLRKSLERNASFGSAQLFLMVALSLTHRRAPRSGLGGRVIPPAISRIPLPRVPAALAVALGFSRLPRPGLSVVRTN
jgi:tetratricopeptide (TPR) repeat protein